MTDPTIYAASWLISPEAEPVPGGAILACDGIIAAKGTVDELRSAYSAPIVEYPDCALLPGFVNAHSHLELTHYPAWFMRSGIDYHPQCFTDWIIQLIRVKRGVVESDYFVSLQEGVRMCLEAGTTAVGDIISNPALALLYRKLPLAGRHYFELLGQDEVLFESKRAAALEAIESIQSGLMKPGLSPHAPYTIGEKNLLTIRNDSHTLGLPLAIHLSESADETDLIFDSSGPLAEKFYPFVGWGRYLTPPRSCSSTELLDRFSLLNQHTLAVHCVHLTAGDARILKERDVSIVLCPRSNDRLDVGRAPVPIFNKLGIRLAIGTDSLASNDSISLWDELRYALDAFPHELTPFDLLKMATIGGATALGQAEEFGTLEVGKRADFQVVENIGNGAGDLIERVMLEGIVREVYTAGKRFTGFAEKNVHNAVEKRGRYGTED